MFKVKRTYEYIKFPDFTLVNRVVPKVAFYSHLEVTACMKSAFVEM